MYEFSTTKKFKKSFKRIEKSGKFDREEFEKVVYFLINKIELPGSYNDHPLVSNLFGSRECHLAFDLLLVYEINDQNKILALVNIGSHSQVFGD